MNLLNTLSYPFLAVAHWLTNLALRPDNSDAEALAGFVAFFVAIGLAIITVGGVLAGLILWFHHA